MDPTDEGDLDQPEVYTPRHTVAVYLSLGLAVLMAMGLIAATGIRWLTQRTPSSIVVFHADASMADGVITLRGPESGDRTATIAGEPEFTTPVFLEPGSYTITVKAGGRVMYHDTMYVAEGNRYDIDITAKPATQP